MASHLLLLSAILFAGAPELQQGTDAPPLPLRLGFQAMPLPFPIDLGEFPAPTLSRSRSPRPQEAGRTVQAVPDTIPGQELPLLLQSEFAQIGVRLRGRGEFGGDWNRFEPCEDRLQESCNPGLFPQLRPDIQFGIQVMGTVADRIHVDVDYDEAREFSATNNVNIFYQGEEGAWVQRVEVGDVTLTFPESRFLTQGIPAGNFGFRALTDLGPLDVQAVWAQQNGDISSREYQLSGVGDRQAFIQDDTLVLDDADYVKGQFFFLTDPREIDRFPHVDVLALDPGAAPPWAYPRPHSGGGHSDSRSQPDPGQVA